MNGADLIAGILKQEGIEVIPCFPHSDLIEAGAQRSTRNGSLSPSFAWCR